MLENRWIARGFVAGLVLVGLVLAGPGPARAADLPDARVTVTPGNSDDCRTGEATDDAGRRVAFRVCFVPGKGFDSSIADREGRPLSRVARNEGGDTVVAIGGVVIEDREYAPGEQARIRAALESADGPLAGRLPSLLVAAGWDGDSPLVRTLAAHGPAWEDRASAPGEGLHPDGWGCTDPATNCMGCCGPGCWGCTGVCTPECLAHDECVERYGHGSLRCLMRLAVAIDSAVHCLARRCPEDCTDGPADCCGGQGPACISL